MPAQYIVGSIQGGRIKQQHQKLLISRLRVVTEMPQRLPHRRLCSRGLFPDQWSRQQISSSRMKFSLLLDSCFKAVSRRFLITEKGYVGLGEIQTRRGDIAVILFGCNVPLILRRNGDIGERKLCLPMLYIYGFMEGETMD